MADWTYGEVDYLATDARYTSVEEVKERVLIPASDTDRDGQILQAIIAAELAIDIFLGRSFPDTGDNPKVDGVPAAITQAALNMALAMWKEADAPGGVSGGDDFWGALASSETTRRELERSPALVGFKVGFGVA